MREHILGIPTQCDAAGLRAATSHETGGLSPMKNPKLHDEFKAIDMTTGWETPAGYPEGNPAKDLGRFAR